MKLRIRHIRKERGMTLEHLAALIGVSKGHMSELETGKKRLSSDHIMALADKLNVSPVELIARDAIDLELLDHLRNMRSLSRDERKAIVAHAEGLAARRKLPL